MSKIGGGALSTPSTVIKQPSGPSQKNKSGVQAVSSSLRIMKLASPFRKGIG